MTEVVGEESVVEIGEESVLTNDVQTNEEKKDDTPKMQYAMFPTPWGQQYVNSEKRRGIVSVSAESVSLRGIESASPEEQLLIKTLSKCVSWVGKRWIKRKLRWSYSKVTRTLQAIAKCGEIGVSNTRVVYNQGSARPLYRLSIQPHVKKKREHFRIARRPTEESTKVQSIGFEGVRVHTSLAWTNKNHHMFCCEGDYAILCCGLYSRKAASRGMYWAKKYLADNDASKSLSACLEYVDGQVRGEQKGKDQWNGLSIGIFDTKTFQCATVGGIGVCQNHTIVWKGALSEETQVLWDRDRPLTGGWLPWGSIAGCSIFKNPLFAVHEEQLEASLPALMFSYSAIYADNTVCMHPADQWIPMALAACPKPTSHEWYDNMTVVEIGPSK